MELDDARAFITSNHRAVLSTTRRDGRPALSPVVATIDDEGRAIVSTRETAMKTHNLRRDPYATLCVMNDAFFGSWVQVEGPVSVIHLPDAMEPLVDYYRRISGEHPDWAAYREAMERERRVLLQIEIVRAGPNRSG